MATIKQRGDSYQIIVSCGYDTHGKHIRRTMTWTPDPNMTVRQAQKELNRQATLFEERVRNGGGASGSVKFETFCEQWFKEYAEQQLKASTIARYRTLTRRIYAAIGSKRLDKITVSNIQCFVDNLSEQGIREPNRRTKNDGKKAAAPLSPKTVRHYASLVSTVLDYAVKRELIPQNPCRKVTLPRLDDKEKDIYTLEEAARFIELLEALPDEQWQYRCFFELAVYTGMRRGELLGLQWCDLDFDACTVSINRTSYYTPSKGLYVDTPKTRQSCRVLKLPDDIFDMLRRYRTWQREQRLRLGDQWHDSDRLFTRWNGEPMFAQTPYTWLTRFCDRNGLRRMGVHSFRHLNATLLIDAGTDVRTTAALLGHSTPTTTLNIYSHSFAAAQARASQAVADALPLGKKKPSAKAEG